jgi:F-box/WD-40 domain protein 7
MFHGDIECFIINDGKLYSGSGDTTIKVWNCSNHSLIATLRGHTNTVYDLAIHDGKLYSSGDENLGDENNEEQDPVADTPSIKVWNCSNHKLITTLRGHTDDVLCLTAHDGKLYSGSDDHAIKIWNCSTNKLIKTLTDHTDDLVNLTVQYGKLYSVIMTQLRYGIAVIMSSLPIWRDLLVISIL